MALDVVAVAPAVPLLHDVPGFGEVGHEAIGRALGDIEGRRQIAQPGVWVLGEEQHRSRVIGQKAPLAHADDSTLILESFCWFCPTDVGSASAGERRQCWLGSPVAGRTRDVHRRSHGHASRRGRPIRWFAAMPSVDGPFPAGARPTGFPLPDTRGSCMMLPATSNPLAQRRCGRCREWFEGDPTLHPTALPAWWLCAICRVALLGAH